MEARELHAKTVAILTLNSADPSPGTRVLAPNAPAGPRAPGTGRKAPPPAVAGVTVMLHLAAGTGAALGMGAAAHLPDF